MVDNYSTHDWRRNTDEAYAVNGGIRLPVNSTKVVFYNPRSLKEETIDLSRLVRVFVNNQTNQRKSIK